ncbi:MAG: gamma-glutamyltransferase, partial [Firmicutes bacterium]|nr:gamma-glutamyltransferase [Bacillota bacterium]
ALERGFDAGVAAALEQLGHRVVRARPPIEVGGGQIIWRDPDTGVYIAGSDPRKDGQAVGY